MIRNIGKFNCQLCARIGHLVLASTCRQAVEPSPTVGQWLQHIYSNPTQYAQNCRVGGLRKRPAPQNSATDVFNASVAFPAAFAESFFLPSHERTDLLHAGRVAQIVQSGVSNHSVGSGQRPFNPCVISGQHSSDPLRRTCVPLTNYPYCENQ